jgi:hypothetical protein
MEEKLTDLKVIVGMFLAMAVLVFLAIGISSLIMSNSGWIWTVIYVACFMMAGWSAFLLGGLIFVI